MPTQGRAPPTDRGCPRAFCCDVTLYATPTSTYTSASRCKVPGYMAKFIAYHLLREQRLPFRPGLLADLRSRVGDALLLLIEEGLAFLAVPLLLSRGPKLHRA